MIDCKLDDNMLTILKGIIGSELISFELDDDKIVNNRAFGVIRINTSINSVEVYNDVHEVDYFGDNEDVSYFTCITVDTKQAFKGYYENSSNKKVSVNEKIVGVQIVSDEIRVGNQNYNISFDRAIIIKTERQIFMISRDWHFMETMLLTCDKNIDEIVPIEKVIADWSNDGEFNVCVKRKTTDLQFFEK